MNNIGEIISIIVPIYNAELYLSKCIESILNQTYKHIQIILVDDGSTDDSGNICDIYSKQDNRIEVYHTDNHGLVATRKRGLEVAIGDYIGFVDADDYIEPSMFSELIKNIKENDADFVHFGFIEESSKGSISTCSYCDTVLEMKDKYEKINFLCNHVLKKMDVTPSIWSKLFKSNFIKKCYKNISNKQQYGEDMICLCYCILEATRISLSKKALYHYNVRENSLSHLDTREHIIHEVKLWGCILSILDKNKCEDLMKESIFEFLKERIVYSMERISEKKVRIPRYFFVNLEQIYEKNIVIYGAGNVGQDYYTQICQFNNCKVVAWVDLQWYKYSFDFFEVTSIEKIRDIEFDMIIIAVADEQIRKEIKNTLICEGYLESNICWQSPGIYY